MRTLGLALAGALGSMAILMLPGPVHGQVCGDATGDGVVTEADGTEVLREAAAVASQCSSPVCDTDGSGAVDDTDAVIAFRLAEDLPVETACSFGGGEASEVETLSADVTPFFGILLPEAPGFGANGAQIVSETEDCPAGGTRTKRDLGTQLQVQFDLCRIDDPLLGSYEFDGNVALNLQLPQFFIRVDILDLTTDRLVHFEGPIDAAFGPDDTVIFDGGPVVITTPLGDFHMTFDGLVVDEDGRPRDGAAAAADTEDNFALALVTFNVNDDVTANLVADFDDASSATFVLNLITGELTPVG